MPDTIADSLQIQHGGGATGLSSRSRYDGGRTLSGPMGTYSNRSDVLPLLQASDDRSFIPSGGISRGGGILPSSNDRSFDPSGGVLRGGGSVPANAADQDRQFTYGTGTRRTDTGRAFSNVLSDAAGGGGNSPVIGSTPVPGAQDTSKDKTPFDFSLESLFRGFFGEPVRGSANKSGEFVFIPPASSQSSGPSTVVILLVLLLVGGGGYYAYKKGVIGG